MSDLVEKLRILYGICRGELRPKTYTPVADVDVMLEQAADRIEALEAALREIADTKDSKDLGLDEPETYDDQNMIDTLIWIARRALEVRALEGKHE